MLKRTPLYEEHIKLGAKMVEFAGWEMPVSYSSIIEEHKAARSSAGLFDISHMGIMPVTGQGALGLIQKLATNDASKLAENKAQYSILCNESGGAIDDVLVYKLPGRYMIIVNASNTEKDLEWIRSHAGSDIEIALEYSKKAFLSLQGPKAENILEGISEIDGLKHNHCREGLLGGAKCLISRTGYTGEDGFEFLVNVTDVESSWRLLLEKGRPKGLLPCGLGARDSLRLEAGLPLYGHEYNEEIGPIEAGYSWAVKFNKGEFVGKEALLKRKETPEVSLAGIKAKDRGIPRQGHSVYIDPELKSKIGTVTSGTMSPSLGMGIALAYLKKEYTIEGSLIFVEIRGKPAEAEVVPLPFYPHKYKK